MGRTDLDQFHVNVCLNHVDKPQLYIDYSYDRIDLSHRDENIPEWNFLLKKYVDLLREYE